MKKQPLEKPSGVTDVNGANSSRIATPEKQRITINPPNFRSLKLGIVGIDPMVIHGFGKKAHETMTALVTRSAMDMKSKRRTREPRDFERDFRESRHISTEGWDGINAISIKAGMVGIATIKNFFKTTARIVLFVEADGFSNDGLGTPLVKITKGTPKLFTGPVRNANGGTDLRTRAWFDPGWEASPTITFDADVFGIEDVTNLLHCAGLQSGTGEGRPSSKMSVGCGWGRYKIKGT